MYEDWLNDPFVRESIARALKEDIGSGDATSCALVDDRVLASASLLTREHCVVAGGEVAAMIFQELDDAIGVEFCIRDGAVAEAGDVILRLHGRARRLLTAERTALNFMQRMCGIATQTRRFVDAVASWSTQILDTRKTTPGLRSFEKYAVSCGGGTNHRYGLYDKVMIKDNHRRLWVDGASDDLEAAVEAARVANPGLEIEIEVENESELMRALRGAPDWVLLDNMSPAEMARCVKRVEGRCKVEASGGITLEGIQAVAATGVDAISLGCLTHTVRSIDLSLELQ